MPQQVPKDFSGPAPRDGELPSEVGCLRSFGPEAVQGLSEFFDPLLVCGDEAILLQRLLFRLAQLDIPFMQLVTILPHAPYGVFELSRSLVIGGLR
jgi:hypothetical protein